jgi:hypothetical protein
MWNVATHNAQRDSLGSVGDSSHPLTHLLRRIILLVFLSCIAASIASAQSVLTQHNDNSRTGQNLNETTLTTSNVTAGKFGKLFSLPVLGQVYAQPLYIPGITINGGTHNVLIVAAQNDVVYAFDADSNTGANASPLWTANLVDAAHGAGAGETPLDSSTTIGCTDTQPLIGISGTPVIDSGSNTIYVEAKSTNGSSYFHRLHSLVLATGAEKSPGPALITATVNGTGDGSSGGKLTFDPLHQQARPGLLLLNGAIYVAFASHCDFGPYHGWIFAYDETTLSQKSLLITSPNGGLGGFWMSGAGIAADSNGNIYIASGNGDFDTTHTPATELGDTILKLGTTNETLTLLDYFTPFDQQSLSNNDTDLGSGGVLLLPQEPGAHPDILVAAGKEGTIYVIDRDMMTKSNSHYCASSCNNSDPEISVEESSSGFIAGMWSMPAYWNNTLYYIGQNGSIISIPIASGIPNFTNITSGTIGFPFPGATPSISSNGTVVGTAILWAIDSSQYGSPGPGPGPAVLHAFDATNVAKELWNSSQVSTDKAGNAVKFAVPTVINGKVYVGTSTEVDVYGLLGTQSPAATPTFSPVAGTYTTTQNVTLNDTTSGASIYYTTNGNTPTTSSTLYNHVAIPVSSSETIKAIAVATGFTQSAVGSAAYVISAPPPPDFSVSATPASQSVTPGASTTYTVTIGSLNGFGGVVTLSLGGQPTGATPGFSPATVTGSGTSTLTITTTAATATGTYPLTITGTSGSVTHTASISLTVSQTATLQINSGGGAVSTFVADKDFSGGNASSVTTTINTTGVANAAPAAVYQSERWGVFTYTIPNLTPNGTYTVRLHFAELAFSTVGARVFNVAINGTTVLSNFDIFATAGAANKALVEQFTATASATGTITISYIQGTANDPKSSGIEIIPATPAPPVVQINSGGGAVSPFVADEDFSGGNESSVTSTITTTGVANAAPAAVYQSERWGVFTYTIPNLTPAHVYTVRLHFAEIAFSTAGARLFSVTLNGTTVLNNFDIFATAGAANKALVEQFTTPADATGKITISYVKGTADDPKSSGIEIIP